jgi:hypothetical protein
VSLRSLNCCAYRVNLDADTAQEIRHLHAQGQLKHAHYLLLHQQSLRFSKTANQNCRARPRSFYRLGYNISDVYARVARVHTSAPRPHRVRKSPSFLEITLMVLVEILVVFIVKRTVTMPHTLRARVSIDLLSHMT